MEQPQPTPDSTLLTRVPKTNSTLPRVWSSANHECAQHTAYPITI